MVIRAILKQRKLAATGRLADHCDVDSSHQTFTYVEERWQHSHQYVPDQEIMRMKF